MGALLTKLTKLADAEGQLRGPILDDVADALSAHLALEEEQLYPPCARIDAAKLSALGEQMTSELARLQEEHPRARIFGRTLSARP